MARDKDRKENIRTTCRVEGQNGKKDKMKSAYWQYEWAYKKKVFSDK